MIVGVDVSSRRVDLAWLEDGKPQRWHQELAKGHLIDRLRSIQIVWPRGIGSIGSGEFQVSYSAPGGAITDIAIEYPFGRGNAVAALMATVGVITKQAPYWARVAWPSSGELRAAISAKNSKQAAHDELIEIASWHDWQDIPDWNDHECDALVACLGWTRILEAQE